MRQPLIAFFRFLVRRDVKSYKCNPCILDLDGNARWQVIAEAIRRMAVGEAPDPLPTRQVRALDYELLLAEIPDDTAFRPTKAQSALLDEEAAELANIKTEEDFERWFARFFPHCLWPPLEALVVEDVILQRLQELFLATRQSEGQILLCIDYFHRLLGGGQPTYPIDAHTLLKPILARGEIQFIGACTLAQYRQWIERDAAFQRRFQEVLIPPQGNT